MGLRHILYRILYAVLAVTLLFTVSPGPALQPEIAYATGPQTIEWHTVTHGLNQYKVYRITDNAGNTIKAYATYTGGARVTDPSLELLLIHDAATLDKDPSTFLVPTDEIATLRMYQYTWASRQMVTSASPPYELYVPYFFQYAHPSDFVDQSLERGEAFPTGVDQGLNDYNRRSELYADVILASVLQSTMAETSQRDRAARLNALLRQAQADSEGHQQQLDLIGYMLSGEEILVNHSANTGAINEIFKNAAKHTLGVAGAGISGVGWALAQKQFNDDVNVHNYMAAMEFQLALGDADQRLKDIKTLLCGDPYSCTLEQMQTDAMINGVMLAEGRFNRLLLSQEDDWAFTITKPGMAKSSVNVLTAMANVVIAALGIVNVLDPPVGLTASAFIFVLKESYYGAIDRKEGLDNIRRSLLAFTLAERLTNNLPSFTSDRRYALSILNIAYFNLHLYFDQIHQRAGDTAYWIFEENPDQCYNGNYTATCIISKVSDEAYRAGEWALDN
jgi:hypothetical protein